MRKEVINYSFIKSLKNTTVSSIETSGLVLGKFQFNSTSYEVVYIIDNIPYLMVYFSNENSKGYYNIFNYSNGKNKRYFNCTVLKMINKVIDKEIEYKKYIDSISTVLCS